MKLKDFFKTKAYTEQVAKDKATLREELRKEVLAELEATHIPKSELEEKYVDKAVFDQLTTEHATLKEDFDNFEIDIQGDGKDPEDIIVEGLSKL